MFLFKLKRLLVLVLLRFFDGYKRARILKSLNYFETIGDDCYLGTTNFGSEPFLISFGDNVGIGTGVRFINHDMSADMISIKNWGVSDRLSFYGGISVGDNVFIGADSIILPNVKIGSNVVIGAGSVVSKDLASNGVYVGNGRLVKSFEDFEAIMFDHSKSQKNEFVSHSFYYNGYCLRKYGDKSNQSR